MLKYVCLSDLHAGALTSLLTDLSRPKGGGRLAVAATRNSETTTAFKAAISAFLDRAVESDVPPPQLILLGDVLDLQFSKRSDATGNALGFLTALAETSRFSDRVIATAGNHDHALWTDARHGLEAETFAATPRTPEYLSATSAFEPTPWARPRLLDALLREAGFAGCDFRYPNLGFYDKDRLVFLHHGHFIENEYRLMSSLKDRLSGRHRENISADALAAENAGWIDFAWSTFGDAAGLGRGAERLYQNFLTTTGFRRITRQWAHAAADCLSDMLPMSGNLSMRETLDVASQVGFDVTLGRFRDTERYAEVDALTGGGVEGLRFYLEGPSLGQMRKELNELVPEDVTFVFGHTHKPFSERIVADGFARPVKVYNTGGWTLNGPRLDNAEGTAMVLIDDKLNVASVRLFNTPRNGKVTMAHVEMLSDGAPGEEAFRSEIEDWLEQTRDVWTRLATVVGEAYERRQEFLLQLTAEELESEFGVRAAE